jgi:hypothetical protein
VGTVENGRRWVSVVGEVVGGGGGLMGGGGLVFGMVFGG